MTSSGDGVQAVPPSVQLAKVVEPLDSTKAATLREVFGAVFTRIEEWQAEASPLVVTGEDQVHKMNRARNLRLEIKAARVALDKRRKALKDSVLLEGRAIDGAFAIFASLVDPLEKHLLAQEQYAERMDKQRSDALRDARQAALQALGTSAMAMPVGLGTMTEADWAAVLADAQAARAAREHRETERRAAEELERRNAQVAVENGGLPRASAAKADTVPAPPQAGELEAKRPTKAKYMVLLGFAHRVSRWDPASGGDPSAWAREALATIGEEP